MAIGKSSAILEAYSVKVQPGTICPRRVKCWNLNGPGISSCPNVPDTTKKAPVAGTFKSWKGAPPARLFARTKCLRFRFTRDGTCEPACRAWICDLRVCPSDVLPIARRQVCALFFFESLREGRGSIHQARTTRNPMLLAELSGVFELRAATR